MNNFFWSMPPPKSQHVKHGYSSGTNSFYAEFRQDSGAGHGLCRKPNLPTRAKRAARVLWPRPLKRKWGKVLPDKFSSRAGGINGHGPPLLGREINRGWRSRFTLQFAIWMRKAGELARFKRGSLRYNSNLLCLEYGGIDNVGFIPPYNST